MIKATHIYKTYGSLEVLKGVDIQVEKGEVVAIVGPVGSRKNHVAPYFGYFRHDE